MVLSNQCCENLLMFRSLAGCWQIFLGVFRTSHFLSEQGTELGTVGTAYLDFRTPLTDMVVRLCGHPARHFGHEPRITVVCVIFGDPLIGIEGIIAFAQSVFEIVA